MEEVLFREKKYPIRKGEERDGKGNELSKNVISRDHIACSMLGSEGGQRGRGRPVAFCNPCQSITGCQHQRAWCVAISPSSFLSLDKSKSLKKGLIVIFQH